MRTEMEPTGRNRFSMGIHTLYMAVLFPIFMGITVWMSAINYEDMFQIIQRNFDRTLLAVSTVCGTFLDGAAYLEQPVQRYDIGALAWHPEHERLIGFDRIRNRLVTIRPDHGAASPLPGQLDVALIDLAYDSRSQTLYGITDNGTLYRLDPEDGTTAIELATLNTETQGVAVHPDEHHLWIAAHGLVRFDTRSGDTTRVSDDSFDDLTAISMPLPDGPLTGLYHSPDRLVTFDSESADLLQEIPYIMSTPADLQESIVITGRKLALAMQYDRLIQAATPEVGTEAWEAVRDLARYTHMQHLEMMSDEEWEAAGNTPGGLAPEPSGERFFASGDALLMIDTQTRFGWPQGFWPGYASELTPDILRVLPPMRRIHQKLDLTYLYTFYRPPGGDRLDIIYSLDANLDADHSYTGDPDVLPAESVYAMYGRVLLGETYLSRIVEWDEWGLIKTGYAPIRNRAGTINQTVAADINVSIIESRTRIYLLQTVLLGVGLFLFTMVITFFGTRMILRPMKTLNDTALAVAAGDYGEHPVTGPQEFQRLSRAFNHFSSTLKEAEDKRRTSNRMLLEQTTHAELIRMLRRERDAFLQANGVDYRVIESPGTQRGVSVPMAVQGPAGCIAWSGIVPGPEIVIRQTQMDYARIAERLLEQPSLTWDDILHRMHSWKESVNTLAWVNRDGRLVYTPGDQGALRIHSHDGSVVPASANDCMFQNEDVLLIASAPLATDTGLRFSAGSTLDAMAQDIEAKHEDASLPVLLVRWRQP